MHSLGPTASIHVAVGGSQHALPYQLLVAEVAPNMMLVETGCHCQVLCLCMQSVCTGACSIVGLAVTID